MESGEKIPGNPELREGDLFYVIQDGSYHVYKLLAHDKAFSCYHVLAYEPMDVLPSARDVARLRISIGHLPIDAAGFNKPVVLGNMRARAYELSGYHEYLKQTQPHESYTPLAITYFNDGLFLTDEQKHEEAIDAYSKAADLVPLFYEAIDNRAFCKMNLGMWEAAIEDFQLSLQVFPDSTLAEFSIGECHLRMKHYAEAKAQFEKALTIDPEHQLSKNFLEHVNTLL
jgi:tetratricopeptide (TPR) repeat protein